MQDMINGGRENNHKSRPTKLDFWEDLNHSRRSERIREDNPRSSYVKADFRGLIRLAEESTKITSNSEVKLNNQLKIKANRESMDQCPPNLAL